MVRVEFKNQSYDVDITLDKTVRDLRFAIEKLTGLPACQQRLWYDQDGKKVVLEVDKKLDESGVTEATFIEMKDLGKQLPFRMVYITEYVGPLVLYALTYFIACATRGELSCKIHIAFVMWIIHYVKRILETIFIHEFGDMTMPVFNLFKNCTYYYSFALAVGINVNFFDVYNPPVIVAFGLIGMIVSIISNGYCHWILKHLRPPGTQIWAMPKGFLFDYITCPNYFCEIMTWIFFNIMVGLNIAGIAFSCCGIWQMLQWANERHNKYKKMFPDYPNRWVLFPFIH